jgi:Xaa-Pro dipeptidase
MAVTDISVDLPPERLGEIQKLLREQNLDGWLLYDFRGINPIATGVLGLPPLSRRFFVLIPAKGRPIAVTHRIEQQPWRGWQGENRQYLSWESFERESTRMLNGLNRVALEYSQGDGVPYLDRVPAGLLELIRKAGVIPVSSGDLVSAFYSRWSDEGKAGHERAGILLRAAAFAAFDRVGALLAAGEPVQEHDIRSWIISRLAGDGLNFGVDAVVAVNSNAANPHYAPSASESSTIGSRDLVLIDLWGKIGKSSIYADQTWMAYVGEEVPPRVQQVWEAVRDARKAAVAWISERSGSGTPVAGCDADDAARRVIADRGFGEAFIHRTGHSIDLELHGSGPNIDNLETRDTRRLIPGVGFSIEPGIYLPGEFGIRSEIDVYMGADGPIVTTPEPQDEIYLIKPSTGALLT